MFDSRETKLKTLGDRIREARLAKGLTVTDVVMTTKVKRRDYIDYEQSIKTPHDKTLMKISACLGTSYHDLKDGENTKDLR